MCKPFKDCSYLYDIFSVKPVSSANLALVKNSKCDEKNGKIYVCCPETRTPRTYEPVGKINGNKNK